MDGHVVGITRRSKCGIAAADGMIVVSTGTGLQSRKNTTPKTEPIDERRRSSGACVKKKPCSKANPYAETSLRGSDQVSSLQGFMARHYETSNVALLSTSPESTSALGIHALTPSMQQMFKSANFTPPSLPSTTPLPPQLSKRQYPHHTDPIRTLPSLGPVPKHGELERYEAVYNVITKRMLSKAPTDIRDDLFDVVAIVLGRCRELEDKIVDYERKATTLAKNKISLNQKAQQLGKLLASSKSSAKAMSNKARGLANEVAFQHATINKQTNAINKLSDKNLKLASAITKLGNIGEGTTSLSMMQSVDSTTSSKSKKQFDARGDDVTRTLHAKKEMVLTIAALTKENLQWSSKSKILEKDTHLLKDQLRILNEKLRQMHMELEEAKSIQAPINGDALQRLTLEALALDSDNNIKIQTIKSRKVSIAELLEGEDDPLGKIISDPTVDIVLLLIQFRNLVKFMSSISTTIWEDDVVKGVLSAEACRVLGCEHLGLYVVENNDTMWYVTSSQPNKKRYSLLSDGLAGAALEKGETVRTYDPLRHPNFNATVDIGCASVHPKNTMSIPIHLNGKPLATLQLINSVNSAQEALRADHPGEGSSFTAADELLAKMLLTQTVVLLSNCQATSTKVMQMEACMKYLLMPTPYLKPLVLDVLFPTREIDPEQQIIWTMKRLQIMIEHTLNVKKAKVFIVDSKRSSLWSLNSFSAEPQQTSKRIFSIDLGLCGRMATAGGKVTIIDAQKDPRINLDVDLDTDDDPLHCCTLQAISGQVMAIIQIGGSSLEVFNNKFIGSSCITSAQSASSKDQMGGAPTHLSLINALELVCEQTAPYLETVLQVMFPNLGLTTYQPRKGTREAMLKADTDAIMDELAKAQEKAESARQQVQDLTNQVSSLESIKCELTCKMVEVNHQLQQTQNENVGQREKLHQAREHINVIQASLDEALRSQAALKAELQDKQTSSSRRASAKTAADEALKAKTAEMQRMQADLQKVKDQSAADVLIAQLELSDLQCQYTASIKDLDILRKANQDLLMTNEYLKSDQSKHMEELQQELVNTKKAKGHTEAAYEALKNEQMRAETGRSVMLQSEAKLYQDLLLAHEALKVKYDEAQKALTRDAQSCQDMDGLRQRVAGLEAENVAVHDIARQEVQNLKDELLVILRDIESYKAKLAEKENLESEVESLKEQIAKLQGDQIQQQEAAKEQEQDPVQYLGQAKDQHQDGTSEWDEYQDEEGRVYYLNHVTGETSWEKPGDVRTYGEYEAAYGAYQEATAVDATTPGEQKDSRRKSSQDTALGSPNPNTYRIDI